MSERPIHTIADIAALAGVSKSTVSRALSDSPLIGAETKDRIRAIAQEHSFQVNASARRLSLKLSRTVGFVTRTCFVARTPEEQGAAADLFDLEIMGGASRGLYESSYDMLVVHGDPQDRSWARRYLETGRVDGFILLTSNQKQADIEMLLALRAPFVVWGAADTRSRYPSVAGDNFAGGRLATDHLIRSGRTRIGFIGGPARAPEVRQRYEGYEAALRASGSAVDPRLVAHGDFSDAAATRAATQLLERVPELDALFVNSDLMAVAAIGLLRAAGRRVPDDVAVVGYDDLPVATYSNPPLTTVRQDVPEAGRLLAQNLIQYIETGVVTNVVLPVELVVRESA